MFIVHSDQVFRVEPNTKPDYRNNNPLLRVMSLIQQAQLAAEREYYLHDTLQYLFPYNYLQLYNPSSPAETNNVDPTTQDDKNDFQKQNIRDFRTTDTHLIRGWIIANNITFPFLRVSYRGGPDSKLSQATNHKLGDTIKLWIKVGAVATSSLITVPYNERSDRYEVEFWGYTGNNLRDLLDSKGRAAIDRGELQIRTDLIHGSLNDFSRDVVANQDMRQIAPTSSMHPILPLHIELCWANFPQTIWDSQNGANYHYEFNMIQRGWDQYLQVGISPNPHGGFGFLEFRNLMSNYFDFKGSGELARQLEWWNLDAFGKKVMEGKRREEFMAVDYMDLHILKPECGIGLHRHRDNQEIFLMMSGRGYMVVGDWCKLPTRERCFEIRTLKSGSLAMLKGGNLHGLMNATDEDISLFMFGGYD
ncbi:cupin domain-containing protein [Nostoc sphaeroides CHAB 2801]|uniref:cupin domain-containing protein n=1 Tax=Nostoc sphaeroides TaxID=446679 RepID=UPI000E5107BA|nr:cupin domain-containing protein [Nostoc sphaeroides]MCC5630848.1 cupin domain-containing protein [Nostoc sphaeroides CHAB 2801]